MMFKDKEKAFQEIADTASAEAQFWASGHLNRPIDLNLAQIIGAAVAAGIQKAIELQYSQEDLESDLGLKS